MPERRLTGIPPIRIEQNKAVNRFVKTYAKWHLKAEVLGVENILKAKELLLDQKIPVMGAFNHLGHLDGPLIAIEFNNFAPALRDRYVPVMGEVIWRDILTRIPRYADNGVL